MSSRDRAQARQLQVGFTTPAESRRGRGGGERQDRPAASSSNSGRGFTLSRGAPAQQLNSTPLMTTEQAAQQRRQLQTDRQEESRRRRDFNTDLTNSSRGPEPVTRTNGGGGGSGVATPREDMDDRTLARHTALLERVTMLVNDSSTKLSSFRSAVRQFRSNESGAKDMIDTIFHVLDRDVDATTGVVREIAELFDGDGERDKQKSVLEALNGFRVEVCLLSLRNVLWLTLATRPIPRAQHT